MWKVAEGARRDGEGTSGMKAKHKDKDKDNVDYKSSAAITARDRIRGLKRIRGGGRRVGKKSG